MPILHEVGERSRQAGDARGAQHHQALNSAPGVSPRWADNLGVERGPIAVAMAFRLRRPRGRGRSGYGCAGALRGSVSAAAAGAESVLLAGSAITGGVMTAPGGETGPVGGRPVAPIGGVGVVADGGSFSF